MPWPTAIDRILALMLGMTMAISGLCEENAKSDEPTPQRGAYAATQCREAPQCPLFDEVYAATPAFRHALALSLRHGDEQVPDWIKDKLPGGRSVSKTPALGTASPMLPVSIDDRPYILGRMTDPQSSMDTVVALYDTHRGISTVYFISKHGQPKLLGDETAILQKVIKDYVNTDSDFARALARPDLALPIPVSSR